MPTVRRPNVYMIAGPNGAGKSTFAAEFLPDYARCREFVNADLIAAGLSPFAPETQAIRAGRLTLTRIGELAEARADFGFETTLAGRSYVRLAKELRRSGYRVTLYFLWLPSDEVAVARVAERVSKGGHDIPVETIRRRYEAGIRHFFREYSSIVDAWQLYNGSVLPPSLIASFVDGVGSKQQPELFATIWARWGS